MSDLSERAAQLPEMTGFLLRFGDNASALGVADSAFRAAPADSCLLGWRSLGEIKQQEMCGLFRSNHKASCFADSSPISTMKCNLVDYQ